MWKLLVTGGREECVIQEPVDEYNFAIAPKGIYYSRAAATPLRNSMRLFRFETGQTEEVVRFDKTPALGLAISPDERWLLYSRFDQEGSDLMLVDHFR